MVHLLISKIMDTLKNIQGVIFDYGGTIDTNSCHWAEVLWTKYMEHQVPVDKESFREAYVFGERALAKYPLSSLGIIFMMCFLSRLNFRWNGWRNRESCLWMSCNCNLMQ